MGSRGSRRSRGYRGFRGSRGSRVLAIRIEGAPGTLNIAPAIPVGTVDIHE